MRSSTAIARAVAGTASTNEGTWKGRYRRTFTRPTRSPRATIHSTISCAASAHETVEWMVARGERVGLLKVRLYRPFHVPSLIEALPAR